jgi:hypothetical protein
MVELASAEVDNYDHCVTLLMVLRTYRILDGALAGRVVQGHWIDGWGPWAEPPEGLESVVPSHQSNR